MTHLLSQNHPSSQSNTTRAARAAQSCTDDGVRMWMPVLCGDDEVTKSGGTGITTAYTEDMLSRERTMDCIMHCLLGDNAIY